VFIRKIRYIRVPIPTILGRKQMINEMVNEEIGRVLRASTTGFAVGCRVSQLQTPAFGSLVKAHPADAREAIYGLIYNIHVDDDPLVQRLVLAESPHPEAIQDQRENRMLPIEMSVITVGYVADDWIHHRLPPRPPLNLDPVEVCLEKHEVTEFSQRLGYLSLLLRAIGSDVPVDQLLVAHITHFYQARGEDKAWIQAVVEELIDLLRDDYEMLMPTLEALSTALPALGEETGVLG
jgi:hypothetical protein